MRSFVAYVEWDPETKLYVRDRTGDPRSTHRECHS